MRKVFFLVTVLLIVAGIITIGFPIGATAKDIKVGAIINLTGPASTWGQFHAKGHKDYFNYVNEVKGGVAGNKIDLTGQKQRVGEIDGCATVYLSVKTGEGLDLLESKIKERVGFKDFTATVFTSRQRHLDALHKTKNHLEGCFSSIDNKALELIAEDLRLAQNALGEITGEVYTEDLLTLIFSDFCIGKISYPVIRTEKHFSLGKDRVDIQTVFIFIGFKKRAELFQGRNPPVRISREFLFVQFLNIALESKQSFIVFLFGFYPVPHEPGGSIRNGYIPIVLKIVFKIPLFV